MEGWILCVFDFSDWRPLSFQRFICFKKGKDATKIVPCVSLQTSQKANENNNNNNKKRCCGGELVIWLKREELLKEKKEEELEDLYMYINTRTRLGIRVASLL